MNDSATLETPRKVTAAAEPQPEVSTTLAPGALAKPARVISPTCITLQILAPSDGKLTMTYEIKEASGWDGNTIGCDGRSFYDGAVSSCDEHRVIAGITYNYWEAAVACNLQRVGIECDPEECPLESYAGTRVMTAAKKLADMTGGKLCDDIGRELTDIEVEAVGKHIDARIKARTAAQHKATLRAAPVLADGSRKVIGPLSFQSRRYGPKGALLEISSFDVPAMGYYQGAAAGYRAAGELMAFAHRHHGAEPFYAIRNSMKAAAALGSADVDTESPAHVAAGFFEAMAHLLTSAGRQNPNKKWIESKADHYDRSATEERDWRAEEAANFSARMKAAKAAKKAQREGGAA